MKIKLKQPVIGNGFIAKKFRKYSKTLEKDGITIYAAGISNSSEKKVKEFSRELNKLKKFCKNLRNKIIYISTYSISDKSRSKRRYVKNKIKIEKFIKRNCKNYLIIRLPEIVGFNKNPNTLTNYFYKSIKDKKKILVYENTTRNLLDVDDAIKHTIKLIKRLKNKNKTINLLNKNFYTPLEITKIFEKVLNRKANYKTKFVQKYNLNFKNNYFIKTNDKYLKNIVRKYYK